jgi:hypothetical protein
MFGEMRDTSPLEQERYFERLARLSVENRARLVGTSCARMRLFVRAGLAHYHPDASEEELRARLAVRLYGKRVAERLFKNVPSDAT